MPIDNGMYHQQKEEQSSSKTMENRLQKTKVTGPRTDPCGIPIRTSFQGDSNPPTQTLYL